MVAFCLFDVFVFHVFQSEFCVDRICIELKYASMFASDIYLAHLWKILSIFPHFSFLDAVTSHEEVLAAFKTFTARKDIGILLISQFVRTHHHFASSTHLSLSLSLFL